VDGNGNRVAALSFGPAKTVVVVGVNKIVRNLEEAQTRIETYAAPMNNKRLDRPNPCVKAGVCQDCSNETRICRAYQVLRRRPSLSDFTVVVVGSYLGLRGLFRLSGDEQCPYQLFPIIFPRIGRWRGVG